MGDFYEVIVGNIGKVHEGGSYMKAFAVFQEYIKKSDATYGRASGENVALWKNNEPHKEYSPVARILSLCSSITEAAQRIKEAVEREEPVHAVLADLERIDSDLWDALDSVED